MGDCLRPMGVAKELLLRSRGRGGGRGVVCRRWAGRAFRAGKVPRDERTLMDARHRNRIALYYQYTGYF